jgi:uncharacterized protein
VSDAVRRAIEAYVAREARPADKLAHQPRLYALAHSLGTAGGAPFDDDVLHAAAWLHDLGVFTGHRPEDVDALARWDHVAYAAREIPGILAARGFPAEKTPAVLAAVRAHMPASTPGTAEGVLLRDADILEQLGAVTVLRTVSKVGRDTRFRTHADAVAALRRQLATLPAQIRTDAARALAKPRIAALQSFLGAVDSETSGVL